MPIIGKKAYPLQLGLSKEEFKDYLTNLRTYVREKQWTRMWFRPHLKTFRPFFKGMEFELFEKIQPNYKKYVGEEIVEVRIVVDPRAVKHPIMANRSRTMDMMAIRILVRVFTIGVKKGTEDQLMVVEDPNQRVIGVNYYLDDLQDGKFKITLHGIEMLVRLMLSAKIKTTPTNGINHSVLLQELAELSKKAKTKAARKKAKKNAKK
jgi:hypothetical protein